MNDMRVIKGLIYDVKCRGIQTSSFTAAAVLTTSLLGPEASPGIMVATDVMSFFFLFFFFCFPRGLCCTVEDAVPQMVTSAGKLCV